MGATVTSAQILADKVYSGLPELLVQSRTYVCPNPVYHSRSSWFSVELKVGKP